MLNVCINYFSIVIRNGKFLFPSLSVSYDFDLFHAFLSDALHNVSLSSTRESYYLKFILTTRKPAVF